MNKTLNSASEKELLKERAYREIKELILTGVFPGGTFLSKRVLQSRLKMSNTPVQSALERLQAEGFVAISPQQGVVVREFSVREIVDLMDIRVLLETFVVSQLAGRLTPDQAKQLRATLKAQGVAVEKGDAARCTRLDADFHLMLADFLGNREIIQVMRGFHDKMYRVTFGVLSQSIDRIRGNYKKLLEIADAVIEGDAERAGIHMREHIEYGRQSLMSAQVGEALDGPFRRA